MICKLVTILMNFQLSSNEKTTNQIPSSSLFLQSNDNVLLDSAATGPWMIVSGTGIKSFSISVLLFHFAGYSDILIG